MATNGQFSWPSVGSSVAAYGQFFMAANRRGRHGRTVMQNATGWTPAYTTYAESRQALSTLEGQKALDLRKHCARGGTRTTFRALQALGTPENMRNPKKFEGCTAGYEAKSVDNVHTLFSSSTADSSTDRSVPTSPARTAWAIKRRTHPAAPVFAAYAVAWSRTCRI